MSDDLLKKLAESRARRRLGEKLITPPAHTDKETISKAADGTISVPEKVITPEVFNTHTTREETSSGTIERTVHVDPPQKVGPTIEEIKAKIAAKRATSTGPTINPASPPPSNLPPQSLSPTQLRIAKLKADLAARKAQEAGEAPISQVVAEAAAKEAIAKTEAHKLPNTESLIGKDSNPVTPHEGHGEVALDLPSALVEHDLEGDVIREGQVVMRGKNQITEEDLNENQIKAVKLAKVGESFCLIGSAGSGKTTTTRIIAQTLQSSGLIREITSDQSTKWLVAGAPSIVFLSFTNQAVTNIREAVPEEFKKNCLTIHKLLEYAPVFYEITDEEGNEKKTMRYEPMRNEVNPIYGLTHVVVEEAGSVSTDLWQKLIAALRGRITFIFLGDLNQIPPVFGDAILGFKLLELPVVELTRSYRQDNESQIKLFAYRVLEGKPISDKEMEKFHKPGEFEVIKFKEVNTKGEFTRIDPEYAVVQMGQHMAQLVKAEIAKPGTGFNPEKDVVLIPFNKKFGTIELNKYIAQAYAETRDEYTHEIIAGVNKHYYAIGDFVYWNKNKWQIANILPNTEYGGKRPQQASKSLDRWGNNKDEAELAAQFAEELEGDSHSIFDKLVSMNLDEDTSELFRQASHRIILEDASGQDLPNAEIQTVGDVNSMYLAYALTVHKSQGSEWERVFIIFHHSHFNVNREIIYTAATRARKFCRIYYSGEDGRKPGIRKANDSRFQKGVMSQAIPGNTLEEKLKYFRRKMRVELIKLESARAKATGEKFDPTKLDDEVEARKLLHKLSGEEKH